MLILDFFRKLMKSLRLHVQVVYNFIDSTFMGSIVKSTLSNPSITYLIFYLSSSFAKFPCSIGAVENAFLAQRRVFPITASNTFIHAYFFL